MVKMGEKRKKQDGIYSKVKAFRHGIGILETSLLLVSCIGYVYAQAVDLPISLAQAKRGGAVVDN
jgi:hypothetical protein